MSAEESLRSRARELFHAVQELPVDQRAEVLRRECGEDGPLRSEVESLLHSFEEAGEFLDAPLQETIDSIWVGRRIGHYEILRLIGRGGMGLVFEARQERPDRIVALKLLRLELVSEEVLRRFEFEGELLGRLQHPGIAQVFEAGTVDTEFGRQPFLALELIEGFPPLSYAEKNALDHAARLELVALVTDAVHHAHQRGVIHRDLKPGNILVDGSGQPKVLDFGVAAVTDSDLQTATMHTRAGQLVGTVATMSPEQAAGRGIELDARTDVYSLGVLLYQLLAGRLPHDVRGLSLPEAVRVICERDPVPLQRIVPALAGDCATIVAKALARERDRRYATAADLADDIRRFLADRPIRARPPSTLYLLRKLAQRNLAFVAGVSAILVLLVVGVVLTTAGQLREQRLRLQTEAAKETSDLEAYVANLTAAEAALRAGDVHDARARIEQTRSELVGWEWTHLRLRLDRSEVLWPHAAGLVSLTVSPDGAHVATSGLRGSVELRDRDTGELRWEARVSTTEHARALAFDPTGEILAVGTGDWIGDRADEGPIHLLSVADGAPLGDPLTGHADAVQTLAFHPDGALLVSGSSDRTLRVWDPKTATELRSLRHGNEVRDVAFSSDGSELVSVSWDGGIRRWNTTSWELVSRIPVDPPLLNEVAWSPDEAVLAVGTRQGDVLLFDAEGGERPRILNGHDDRVEKLVFSVDGTRLYSCAIDRTLRSWDVASGRQLGVFLGSTSEVNDLALEPGEETLLSVGYDGQVRRWTSGTQDLHTLHGYSNWVYTVDVSSDGRWIASATAGIHYKRRWPETDGRSYIRLHDLATGRLERTLLGHASRIIWQVSFSPDATRLVSVGEDGTAILWDAGTGERLHVWKHPGALRRAAFDSAGSRVATSCTDGAVRLWDADSGALLTELRTGELAPRGVTFAPDDRWLIVTYYDGHVARWDTNSGALDRLLEDAHEHDVNRAVFDPTGRTFVTAARDGLVRRWDAATLEPLGEPLVHPASVEEVVFTPDGTRLVAADREALRLWDTARWKKVADLRGHTRRLCAVDVSPDGRYLVTGGSDSTVRVWDGGTEAQRLVDRWLGELADPAAVRARIEATDELGDALRVEARALLSTD